MFELVSLGVVVLLVFAALAGLALLFDRRREP